MVLDRVGFLQSGLYKPLLKPSVPTPQNPRHGTVAKLPFAATFPSRPSNPSNPKGLSLIYFSGKVKELGAEKGGKVIVYSQYNASNTACPLSTWHTLVKPKAQAYHQRNAEVLEKYIKGTGEYYQDISWVKRRKVVGDVPYVVFDTETTGLSAFDRIVQIAATQVDKNHSTRNLGGFYKLINPGIPIKPGASAVHGITDDMVKDAPMLEDVLLDLSKDVLGEKGLLVAYNAQFDVGMPNQELMRKFNYRSGAILNRAIDRWNTSKNAKEQGRIRPFDPALVLDPFVLIQRIHPFVTLGKKLSHHYEVLMGKPLTNAHDAQADVDATVNVLKYIFKYLQKHAIPLEWAQLVETQVLPKENPETGEAWNPEEKAAYIARFIRENREQFENSKRFKDNKPDPLAMVDVLMFQHGGTVYHEGKPGLPKLDISLNMFGWDGDKQWDGTDVFDPALANEVRKEQDADSRRLILHKFRDDVQSTTVTEVAGKLHDVLHPKSGEPQADSQREILKIRREMLASVDPLLVDQFLNKTAPALESSESAEPASEKIADDLKTALKTRFNNYLEHRLQGKASSPEVLADLKDRFVPKLTEDAYQHIAGTMNPELGSRSFYTYVPVDPSKPLVDPDVLTAVAKGLKRSHKGKTRTIGFA